MRTRSILAFVAALCLLLAAGCGDDSDDGGGDDSTSETTEAADDAGSDDTAADDSTADESMDDEAMDDESMEDEGSDTGAGGGGPSSVTVGGEEIALGSGLCFLEEQEAAAGGGTIELTGMASGTNAAGEPVTVDFTRYSAESQFAGDDVSVTIGDPFGENVTSLSGSADSGTVSLDGTVLSATDFPLTDENLEEVSVSFEISC